MSATVPLLVKISRPLLVKLQRRYGMPDLGNAFDELVARALTMESARQIDKLTPPIQDADVAKEYYDLDPNWMSMRDIPEFRLRMRQSVLDALGTAQEFGKCGGYTDVFRLLLERGLWGEATDDPRPNFIPGFGNVGGILPISQKDVEDKIEVILA